VTLFGMSGYDGIDSDMINEFFYNGIRLEWAYMYAGYLLELVS